MKCKTYLFKPYLRLLLDLDIENLKNKLTKNELYIGLKYLKDNQFVKIENKKLLPTEKGELVKKELIILRDSVK